MAGNRLTTCKFALAWFAAAAVLAGIVLDVFPAEEQAPHAGSLTRGQLKSEIERLQREIAVTRKGIDRQAPAAACGIGSFPQRGSPSCVKAATCP